MATKVAFTSKTNVGKYTEDTKIKANPDYIVACHHNHAGKCTRGNKCRLRHVPLSFVSKVDLEAFIAAEGTDNTLANFLRGLNPWDRMAATEAGTLDGARNLKAVAESMRTPSPIPKLMTKK